MARIAAGPQAREDHGITVARPSPSLCLAPGSARRAAENAPTPSLVTSEPLYPASSGSHTKRSAGQHSSELAKGKTSNSEGDPQIP